MPEDLETIKEEPTNTECGTVSAKKKGRPFKVINNEEPFIAKPRGRPPKKPEEKVPKKTKDEMRIYYKNYFEENKDQIMLKRAEYRKTENYRQLRHQQNIRYKEKQAQKPKVCLIDIANFKQK